MKQIFAQGPPRVRQLTADEATVLVWRDAGAFGIIKGGHCGHAAIMLRSDKLPLRSQEDVERERGEYRRLMFEMMNHRNELEDFLPQDIARKQEQINRLGQRDPAGLLRLRSELNTLLNKLRQEQVTVARIEKEMAAIKMWENPNAVRYYYLTEAAEGFVRHVYISWFPGGDGVGSIKSMFKSMRGERMEFRDDMDSEMSERVQDRLASGEITPRPGQVYMQDAYGMRQEYSDEWGQEPDYVISVPALGVSNRYWGVSTSKMWNWWREFSDDVEAEYKMISKSKSCAGVALRALAEGGAEAFRGLPKNKIYALPNEVAHYAVDLRAAIVDFNTRTMRFEYNVLQPWIKQQALRPPSRPGRPAYERGGLWSADDWRANRGSQAHTRFSVGDHLKKYHSTDGNTDWARKYRLLCQIFSYVMAQVGDNSARGSKAERNDALITLGSQCLNVLRNEPTWVNPASRNQ